MKLAEALLLRGDMNRKLRWHQLGKRIKINSIATKYYQPGEDLLDVVEEALAVVRERTELMVRINLAKMQTVLPNGMTLSAALARRDRLERERGLILMVIDSSQVTNPSCVRLTAHEREMQEIIEEFKNFDWFYEGEFVRKGSSYRARPALEIREFCRLDIPRLQARLDKLTGRIRDINTQIQTANWQTELP